MFTKTLLIVVVLLIQSAGAYAQAADSLAAAETRKGYYASPGR